MKRILVLTAGFCFEVVNVAIVMLMAYGIMHNRWGISAISPAGLVSEIASPAVGLVFAVAAAAIIFAAIALLFWGVTSVTEEMLGDVPEGVANAENVFYDKALSAMKVLAVVLMPAGVAAWLLLSTRLWPMTISVSSLTGALESGLVMALFTGAIIMVSKVQKAVCRPAKVSD